MIVSDRTIDIVDMAASLLLGYWAIKFTQALWDLLIIVIKVFATEVILS